jgi:hypothetical protein
LLSLRKCNNKKCCEQAAAVLSLIAQRNVSQSGALAVAVTNPILTVGVNGTLTERLAIILRVFKQAVRFILTIVCSNKCNNSTDDSDLRVKTPEVITVDFNPSTPLSRNCCEAIVNQYATFNSTFIFPVFAFTGPLVPPVSELNTRSQIFVDAYDRINQQLTQNLSKLCCNDQCQSAATTFSTNAANNVTIIRSILTSQTVGPADTRPPTFTLTEAQTLVDAFIGLNLEQSSLVDKLLLIKDDYPREVPPKSHVGVLVNNSLVELVPLFWDWVILLPLFQLESIPC